MISKILQVENVFVVVWETEVHPEDITKIYNAVLSQSRGVSKPIVYIAFCGPKFKTPSTAGRARDAVFEYLPRVLEHCGSISVVYDPKGGWIAELQHQGLRAMMVLARILRVEGVERVYAETSIESVLYRETENLERGILTFAEVLKRLRDEGI